MTSRPNYKKILSLVQFALLALFCVFVVLWEKHVYKNDLLELHKQAQVISVDLWNLDPEGPLAYLELAARLNNYGKITVFAVNNKQFVQVEGEECGPLEQLLTKVGLIPKLNLKTEIYHNSKIVGSVEVVQRHDTIYIHLYFLLTLGLIALAVQYFFRTLHARDTLELRVLERTKELQAATQQLRAGEKRYREIYNSPSDAIFMHDADTGKILDVNKGMLDMYGYTYEEALLIDIGRVSSGEHPYTTEEAGQKVQAAILHGPQTFEWLGRKKDDTLFWVEVALKYTEFSGQRYVIAVVRDVNARKQAEKALAAEKERLAVTLRSIGDGVITTDVTGKTVMLNMVAEQLTGWTQAEAVGRPLEEIFHIINEQSREKCENPVDKVLSRGEIIGLANHTALLSKDGSERSIADSGAPIRDKDNKVIGVVLVFRDVSEQIKTEKELLKGKKLESIGVLAGGIAHDFNNILAAILGNINLALFDAELTERTKKLLTEAEKATLRAKDLTQQLLTFAKGGEPVKEVASLASVIRDSANFVLHGDKVACRFEIPDNLWLVDIDKGQISQVIQNIVLNASHAMPEGGIITVTCENVASSDNLKTLALQKGRFVKISIKDEGIGIPGNLVEKIFDPYFSTKQEGSGLGLAVTHSIIIKHGGHISVESSPGVGTTFTLYLPASDLEKVGRQETKKQLKSSSQAKIMVMDDEEMVRDVCREMLLSLGHEVVLAADGEEAVKLYQESMDAGKLIDLLIMDLTIPGGMGGEIAVREVLSINPKARVIVSSGYSNDPIMAKYNDYGFCAAIVKPYRLKELAGLIGKIID